MVGICADMRRAAARAMFQASVTSLNPCHLLSRVPPVSSPSPSFSSTSLRRSSSRPASGQGLKSRMLIAARSFATAAIKKDTDELGDLKKTELQERLRGLGAKISGKKDELLSRLKDLIEAQKATSPPKKRKAAPKKTLEEKDAKEVEAKTSNEVKPVKKKPTKSAKKNIDENLVENPHLIPPEEFENYKEVFSRALKREAKKDSDSIYYATRHRPLITKRLVRSLYRRCLQSAQRCPQDKWMKTMRDYVRMKFREKSNDDIMVRLTAGEMELQEMDYYHTCREKKEKELAGLVEKDKTEIKKEKKKN